MIKKFLKDLRDYLFPFLDKYPLQAKKAEMYKRFKAIVMMVLDKKHLTPGGLKKIEEIRGQIRLLGKKARTYENREGAGKPLAPWCRNT